jgi:hypothetical protein
VRVSRLHTGLILAVLAGVATYALAFVWLERNAGLARTVTGWTGVWYVERDGLIDVALDADADATWLIDGHPAVVHHRGESPSRRGLMLERGFHTVRAEAAGEGTSVRLFVAAPGGPLAPLNPLSVRASAPPAPRLWTAAFEAVRWSRAAYGRDGALRCSQGGACRSSA